MVTARLHNFPRSGPVQEKPPRPATPARTGTWRRAGVALGVLVLLGALLAGGVFLRPSAVIVAPARLGEAVDAIYASGVVDYVRQARVAPVVTAPIRRVYVEEGQTVRAGELLAQLEDGPQLGATLQLEAQAGLARMQADRARRLYDAGFGAAAANDDAQQQRRAAEAAAAGARARLGDYQLHAPFAGRVLRRDAEPGDLASPGTPLFVIADPQGLRITADVDERDIGQVELGQEAVIRSDAFQGQVFSGRITQVTPQGNALGRVFRVRVGLEPSTPLRAGMTVEMNLVTARRARAVLVPAAALKEGAVWAVDGGRARRRAVSAGAAQADQVEILSGLKTGDTVILAPPAKLRDGARIVARTP